MDGQVSTAGSNSEAGKQAPATDSQDSIWDKDTMNRVKEFSDLVEEIGE